MKTVIDLHGGTALDPGLLALIEQQRGMFTTANAYQFGLDRMTLAALVRRGVLRHPGRGLYALSGLVQEPPEVWHLQLAFGATLLYNDVAFTGVTAVLAHGVAVWNAPLTKPSLVRPIARGVGMTAFSVRPRVCRSVRTPWGPAEPLAHALVQHCLDNGITQGVVSADAALHSARVTLEELAAAADGVAQWPRSGRVRSMLTFVNAAHETPGESLTNVACASGGIELVPQVTILDEDGRFVARVDFVVKGTKVIVEFDGRVKYDDDGELFREKKREDRLRALGYTVVRVTWADLMRPGAVVAKVAAGLKLARA